MHAICERVIIHTMKFTSTRNKSIEKSFSEVITDCMPPDGGLYVPVGNTDLRKWILYTNEGTSFASIAGALTSACINDEYSPIICETIATLAFPFEPKLKQIDKNIFMLELYHGPTGCHRDFGVSYLTACLDTILTMMGKKSVFLDVTTGEHGCILARELRGKKNLKSVLVYPKGCVRGLSEEDLAWNGGNIYPVEVDGTVDDCHALVRAIFEDRELVEKYRLTVSNTANIGRLLPQAFFYTYAFSRLKNKVSADIYYALAPGNYSNLVAGLYSWRLSLPVNGFIVPSTDSLAADPMGRPLIVDSMVPIAEREKADPADPSNLERLEDFFSEYSAMIKSFVYPSHITDGEAQGASKELFIKYGVFADYHTGRAYAAYKKSEDLVTDDDGAVVLVARDHPSYSLPYFRHTIGEEPEMVSKVSEVMKPVELKRPLIKTTKEIIKILSSL